MRVWRPAARMFAIACSACSPTELLVSVETDFVVPRELDAVEVSVAGTFPSAPVRVGLTSSAAPEFPLTLAVESDGADELTVGVTGFRHGVAIVRQQRRFQFASKELRQAPVQLLRACRGQFCGPDESCTATGCAPLDRETLEYPGAPVPVLPPSQTLVTVPTTREIWTGDAHTCALKDNDIICWGQSQHGRLGPTDLGDGAATPGWPEVRYVGGGEEHTCLVDGGGTAVLFGHNLRQELGFDSGGQEVPTPTPLQGFNDVVACSGGNRHSCILRQQGIVHCFGDNRSAQLGFPEKAQGSGEVLLADGATMIASRVHATCALTSVGDVYCWGAPYGTPPVRIVLPGAAATLDVGVDFGCAVLTDERVACWGSNHRGQRGFASTATVAEAAPIPGLDRILQTACGDGFACVLNREGRISCWGRGDLGTLGDGRAEEGYQRSTPAMVDVPTATAIAAGRDHVCARLEDGRAACWGLADGRRLTINRRGPQPTPVFVIPLAL